MLDQVLTPLPKVFQKMPQKDQKQILWASNKFKHDVDSEVENFPILFHFLRNIADGRQEEESFAEGGSDSEGPPNNETEGKTEKVGRNVRQNQKPIPMVPKVIITFFIRSFC